VIQITEGADDARVLGRGQGCHPFDAGSRGYDLQTMGAGDDGVFQCALAPDHMTQVVAGVKAQYHVHVGEAKIGVDQHDVAALCGDGHGKIGGYRGFADSSLAAGDGDNLDRTRGVDLCQGIEPLWRKSVVTHGRALDVAGPQDRLRCAAAKPAP
jgi:hypothetical protein